MSVESIIRDETELYEKITIGASTAVGFTNLPDGCNEVLLIVEDDDIRFRTDGTDPTSTTGMPLSPDQNMRLTGRITATQFKAIAVSSSAAISVEYKVR